jgi:hypothetical protein
MVTFAAYLIMNLKAVEYFAKNSNAELKRCARIAGAPIKLTRQQTQVRKVQQE